jgi:hypothetical protein
MERVWNGRDSLTDSLDRDYAAMRGEGWDLIWVPPSPLTTPWNEYAHMFQVPTVPDVTVSRLDRSVQKSAQELRNQIAIQFELDRQAMDRHLRGRHRTRKGWR